MPAWHHSHTRTRLKQTDFTSVRRVRRVGGIVVTFAVSSSAALSLVSRVRLVIAVILFLQRLCVHCAVPDTLVQMLLIFIHETASFGNFLHRTAFNGIRKLPKLLEKTYDQFRCPCFSLRHYTKLITCVTGRLYTSRCCSLYATSKVRAFIEVPAFSGPAFSAPPCKRLNYCNHSTHH